MDKFVHINSLTKLSVRYAYVRFSNAYTKIPDPKFIPIVQMEHTRSMLYFLLVFLTIFVFIIDTQIKFDQFTISNWIQEFVTKNDSLVSQQHTASEIHTNVIESLGLRLRLRWQHFKCNLTINRSAVLTFDFILLKRWTNHTHARCTLNDLRNPMWVREKKPTTHVNFRQHCNTLARCADKKSSIEFPSVTRTTSIQRVGH